MSCPGAQRYRYRVALVIVMLCHALPTTCGGDTLKTTADFGGFEVSSEDGSSKERLGGLVALSRSSKSRSPVGKKSRSGHDPDVLAAMVRDIVRMDDVVGHGHPGERGWGNQENRDLGEVVDTSRDLSLFGRFGQADQQDFVHIRGTSRRQMDEESLGSGGGTGGRRAVSCADCGPRCVECEK